MFIYVLVSVLGSVFTFLLAQFSTYSYEKIRSHAGVRADLFNRPLDQTLITDFFGGVAQVEVLQEGSPVNQTPAQLEVDDSVEEPPSLPTRPPAVLASERPQRMPVSGEKTPSTAGIANATANSRPRRGEQPGYGTFQTLQLWSSSVLVGLLLVWALSR